jgi:predicted enzyme related to lactoylglutathione lyase
MWPLRASGLELQIGHLERQAGGRGDASCMVMDIGQGRLEQQAHTSARRAGRVITFGGRPAVLRSEASQARWMPMPVPGMAWFSTCKDPHGNESGLCHTDTPAPAPSQ